MRQAWRCRRSRTQEVGCRLLEMGIDVLVEKPMAAHWRRPTRFWRQRSKYKRILQVGHVERFNPAVLAVEPVVNRPLFFEVHRLGVFTPRSLDVDVIYDLMIHDLDILLALVKEPVTEVKAVGIPVLTDKVDIAHARLEFAGGAVANVTASRVSTERVRKMRFFQQHEYISLDYARRDALRVGVKRPGPQPEFAFEKLPAPGRGAFARGAGSICGSGEDPGGAEDGRRRGPRRVGIGESRDGKHPGTAARVQPVALAADGKNRKHDSRTLVPLGARLPAGRCEPSTRRRPSTLDERTLVPSTLPIVELDGQSTIPDELAAGIDCDARGGATRHEFGSGAKPEDSDCRRSRRIWTSASRFRRAAAPLEVFAGLPARSEDLVDPDIIQTGEVSFLPPESGRKDRGEIDDGVSSRCVSHCGVLLLIFEPKIFRPHARDCGGNG